MVDNSKQSIVVGSPKEGELIKLRVQVQLRMYNWGQCFVSDME